MAEATPTTTDSATSACPLCGGRKEPGTTTFTADLRSGIVVVRDVPAMVCAGCGEEWIAPDTARRLEQIVERARDGAAQVEITTLSPTAAAA
jgi:YgiT-type zinc finger domain-containing protein